MGDPSSLFYVKNYRAQRVRLNQKYSGSTSVLNRDDVNSRGGRRSSSVSAWGRPDSGSTFSLAGDHSYSGGHVPYHYFHGPNWTPKVSLVSAVKLAGFPSATMPDVTTGANPNNGNREGSVTLPSPYNRPPPPDYRRTLSGGAEWRSNSADPEYTFSLYRGPQMGNGRSGSGSYWEDPTRSTSLERPSDYLYGGSGPRSVSVALSSGHGRGHDSLSTSIMSLDRIGTSVDSGAKVTALARNVSSYTWERPDSIEPLPPDVKGNGRTFKGHNGQSQGWDGTSSHHIGHHVTNNGDLDAKPAKVANGNGFSTIDSKGHDEVEEGHGPDGESAGEQNWTKKRRRVVGNVVPSFLGPEDHLTLARAEARLAARRQARAEAREIRMKELEKQQKESEENADKQFDMYSTDVVNRAAFRVALGNNHRPASHSHSLGSTSYHSSRRSSEESSEDGLVSMRDMRHELKELEDKFRKSMVQNAQLDNEKSALTYHVELLKDKIEDLEEALSQLQRDHKDKSRDFENLKRLSQQLKDELQFYKAQLHEREELIKEYGLVVVENEIQVDVGSGERETRIKRTLVTQETASVLSTLGDGSLDVRLKRVLEEKNELQDELRRLKLDLEEERSLNSKGHYNNVTNHTNGPESDSSEVQREVSKQMADYKYKIQKYEQEILALQANVSRLDGQVTRFRGAAEEAETREDDLKVDKRKLQRELREAQSRLDEVETTNSHLQKRLDKLKTAKSNLLKDL